MARLMQPVSLQIQATKHLDIESSTLTFFLVGGYVFSNVYLSTKKTMCVYQKDHQEILTQICSTRPINKEIKPVHGYFGEVSNYMLH